MADEKRDETLDAAERTDEIGSIEVEDGDRTEENASPEPEMEDLPALVLGDEAEHDAELHEEVIDSEIAWRGKIFDVERLQVRLPNGHTSVRDVVRHRGAAAVVALTTSGKIALVRQYRTSLGRVTVEIPAGKLDPGEDPLECAKRELKEETGFVAGRIAYLTTIATSCGFAGHSFHSRARAPMTTSSSTSTSCRWASW